MKINKIQFTNLVLDNLNESISEDGKIELEKFINLTNKTYEAINYSRCYESELLSCDCPICGNEMTSQLVKHHHCKNCKEHYTTT